MSCTQGAPAGLSRRAGQVATKPVRFCVSRNLCLLFGQWLCQVRNPWLTISIFQSLDAVTAFSQTEVAVEKPACTLTRVPCARRAYFPIFCQRGLFCREATAQALRPGCCWLRAEPPPCPSEAGGGPLRSGPLFGGGGAGNCAPQCVGLPGRDAGPQAASQVFPLGLSAQVGLGRRPISPARAVSYPPGLGRAGLGRGALRLRAQVGQP